MLLLLLSFLEVLLLDVLSFGQVKTQAKLRSSTKTKSWWLRILTWAAHPNASKFQRGDGWLFWWTDLLLHFLVVIDAPADVIKVQSKAFWLCVLS